MWIDCFTHDLDEYFYDYVIKLKHMMLKNLQGFSPYVTALLCVFIEQIQLISIYLTTINISIKFFSTPFLLVDGLSNDLQLTSFPSCLRSQY